MFPFPPPPLEPPPPFSRSSPRGKPANRGFIAHRAGIAFARPRFACMAKLEALPRNSSILFFYIFTMNRKAPTHLKVFGMRGGFLCSASMKPRPVRHLAITQQSINSRSASERSDACFVGDEAPIGRFPSRAGAVNTPVACLVPDFCARERAGGSRGRREGIPSLPSPPCKELMRWRLA